jgi:hypothetical protein
MVTDLFAQEVTFLCGEKHIENLDIPKFPKDVNFEVKNKLYIIIFVFFPAFLNIF